VLALLLATSAAAMADDKENLIRFDIPQQRADLALTLFAEQADLTLVFPYDDLRDKTANPLIGRYTVLEGAAVLLEGTGFEPKFSRRLVMSIAAVEPSGTEGDDMRRERKGMFAGMVSAVLSVFTAQNATGQEAVGARQAKALEEIIVTAQKREEQYLDVPVAVSTISGEVLDMAQTTEFQDLVQVSPSITYNQTADQRGVGVLIRGIGTTAFQTAVEPTVSTVVDGVTMGRTVQFISDLVDIERVEVLRGPQGTLFGKNASAGLINVVTKRPSEVFESTVRFTATDDDAFGVHAQLSGPLSDRIRGRISAYSKEFDGFMRNSLTGETINGDESAGVRAKLEFDLTDNANLLLIGDYSRQDRDCCSVVPSVRGTSGAYDFDWQDLDVNERNDAAPFGTPAFSDTETSGISAELNVNFENFVFTSITAYRGFNLETQQDVDMLPYTEPTYARFLFTSNGATNGGDQEQTQFSEELRIATTAWDNFDLTAGLFYWDQEVLRYFEREVMLCNDPAEDPALSYDPAVTPCNEPFIPFGFMDTDVDTTNWAMFGQANWHFADSWTASLGLRYTQDELDVYINRQTSVSGPAVPPSFEGGNSTDENNLSGKVSLQWNATDLVMFYGSYAEGYKSPAFDLIFGATAQRLSTAVPPETSEAWELGMKSELFDRSLRVGITAFHTTFDDLQGQGTIPGQVGFFLTSAGTAITRGIEVDFTTRPVPNLLLNGGLAYVDAYFDEYPDGPCYFGQTDATGCVGGVQNLAGADIPNSPDWKAAIQARYDVELAAFFDLFVNANYRWQDGTVGNLNQDARLDHESYGIFDLTVGLDSDDGRWTAQVFAKNLFDRFYEDLRTDLGTFDPGGVGHYLSRDATRYVGAQFEYRFGGQ
jgi:iron complex outermembrane receptor protein